MRMRIPMALSAALSLISLTGCPSPECTTTSDCPQTPAAQVCVNQKCEAARCDNGTLTCTGGKVCENTSGACVNCLANNQGCASPAVCNTALNSGAGACVGCLSSTNCTGSTPVCNLTTQVCHTCLADNTGCTGATPACDTAANSGMGACVACTSNATCSGSTPVCNTETHSCVQCATGNTTACTGATAVCDFTAQTCKTCLADNTGCSGATPICDTAANSGAGACVACKDNTTCSSPTAACNTATHSCVECTDDTTCSGATPVCNTGTHTCVACNDNSSCGGSTPVCDTTSHSCVTCLGSDSSGCSGATPVCDASVSGGACVQCLNGNVNACTGATPVCDTAAKSCVTCVANGTGCSGVTPVCDTSVTSGTCVQCLSSQVGACTGTATPVCDTSAKICKTCLSDNTGCLSPLACDTTGNGGLGICFGCTQDNQCTDPLAPVCNTGVTPGTCVQCMSTNAGACVGTTPVCDTTAMTCKTCLADNSGCSGSTPVCIPGSPGQCVQCTSNTTCSGATPACDTAAHACVECLDNSTCSGATSVCKTSSHACVQCLDNTTCSGGTPQCDTAQSSCVTCLSGTNAGCGGGTPLCLSDQTACVECRDDNDCAASTSGHACSTATHTCGPTAMVVKVTGCTDGTCATTAGLTSAAAKATIEEYSVSEARAPIRSIEVPIAASGSNSMLTMNGSSTTEGGLSRSADGKYLTFGGYAAAPATLAINGTTSATVNRILGRLDAAGNIDTSTHLSATNASFSAGNIRGVTTTNGTDFWAVGSNTGVVYATLGAAAGGTAISGGSTLVNMRNVHVFGGQLYVSSLSSTWQGISMVGTGTPTAAGQVITLLNGFPTSAATNGGMSPYSFVPFDLDGTPGYDTIYLTNGNSPSVVAMEKWTLSGGVWSKNATFNPAIGAATFGLTGWVENGKARLVVTTSAGLFTLVDDGTASPAITSLATAPTNSAFRGVALPPAP